jgi:hypothetical protein
MIEGMNKPEVLKSKSESMRITMREKMKDKVTLEKYQEGAKRAREKLYIDNKVYTFCHKNGTIERCLRIELIKKYNLHKGNVSLLVNGSVKSVSGWKLINIEE